MKHILKIISLFFIFCSFAKAEIGETVSSDKYFNLGNAAYENGNFGEAVFNYEKALILDPTANDININLQLAVERLDADIIELDPFFLVKWWNGLSNVFLPGGWKIITLVFFLGFLGAAYMLFFKNREQSKSLYVAGSFFILLMFISLLAGQSRANRIYNNPYAIISEGADSIYEGPDLVSEKIKPVVGGVKVKILDANADWYKIATMDSEQGWIKKDKLRLLKF